MNQVTLFGYIGADPELNYTSSNVAVVNMRLATSKTWTNDQGEKQENTQWHTLVAFGKKAETLAEYVSKGDPLLIKSGELTYNQWEDQNGSKRTDAQVKVYSFQFMGKSVANQEPKQSQSASRQEAAPQASSAQQSSDLPF